MGFLVPFTLFGWIPFVILLFAFLPPRRAVVTAFLLAWLFLPMAGYEVPGLPDYTKMSATTAGVLLGAAIFDADRLLGFRPRWIDIPMFAFCVSPFMSSYLNGLGMYDGVSEIVDQLVVWGLPYLIGRVYFSDLEGLRELALGLFIGGLIYVPLCLFEVRMSPQLHRWIYGFRQHSFYQNMRDGGYRPMVFMQHGLMVAMWMMATTLIGIWLWRSKTVRQVWNVPIYLIVPAMLLTLYLCKSRYAILLMVAGATALYAVAWTRLRVLVVLMLMIPPVYMFARSEQIVTGDVMIETARSVFNADRAQSLEYRITNENLLAEHAMKKPWFGYGGWGGSRLTDEYGKELVTDSLWIITLGKYGWVGLAALTAMLLLPMLLVCYDWRAEFWTHPMVAPVVVLGMMVSLYMFDHLMNGMVNPIFMLACGAVGSAHFAVPLAARYAAPAPQRVPAAPRPGFAAPRPRGFRPA